MTTEAGNVRPGRVGPGRNTVVALCAVIVGALLSVTTVEWTNAAETDELRQLRRELTEQRQKTDALEKRLLELEAKEKARGVELEAKQKGPGYDVKYDGGFSVRSADDRFSLKVNGLAQVRYTLFAPEEGDTNHNFDVALGRLAFSGNVFDPNLTYFMQLHGSTFGNRNGISLLDWWMQYRLLPELSMQAGRFVLPYSRQFYTHPGNLLFPDLSEADLAFDLPRGIGVHTAGAFGRLSLHGAVLNSVRALDGAGQQNLNDKIGVLGRVELAILDPYGYLESSPKPVSAPQFSLGVAAAFNPIDEPSALQNVLPGDQTINVTVDAGFRWQYLTLQAAGYYRRNDLNGSGRPQSHDWGYYGQIGLYLVPERWELAARVSGVDFDKPNAPGTLGDTTAYSLGLNYYLYGHNAKLQADYSFLAQDPFVGPHRSDNRVRLQTQVLF